RLDLDPGVGEPARIIGPHDGGDTQFVLGGGHSEMIWRTGLRPGLQAERTRAGYTTHELPASPRLGGGPGGGEPRGRLVASSSHSSSPAVLAPRSSPATATRVFCAACRPVLSPAVRGFSARTSVTSCWPEVTG